MHLTDKEIQAFTDAWEKDFGERLTIGQARMEMERLLTFFKILFRETGKKPR